MLPVTFCCQTELLALNLSTNPYIRTGGKEVSQTLRNVDTLFFERLEISGRQGENVYQILTAPSLPELEKQTSWKYMRETMKSSVLSPNPQPRR